MQRCVKPAMKSNCSRNREIEQRAQALVNAHSLFTRRASKFKYRCEADVLTVNGNVPTFYLKQVLQSILQTVEGVRRIENEVEVVSATGVSGDNGFW